MINVLLVGVGGFIGSIARYIVSGLAHQVFSRTTFPVGTVLVNITGCLAIGVLSHLAEFYGVFTDRARAFVFIGIIGGFTTFSTFANETYGLFRSGDQMAALVNVGVQVILGVICVWLGRDLAYVIWR